jgi:hypothetical protein
MRRPDTDPGSAFFGGAACRVRRPSLINREVRWQRPDAPGWIGIAGRSILRDALPLKHVPEKWSHFADMNMLRFNKLRAKFDFIEVDFALTSVSPPPWRSAG